MSTPSASATCDGYQGPLSDTRTCLRTAVDERSKQTDLKTSFLPCTWPRRWRLTIVPVERIRTQGGSASSLGAAVDILVENAIWNTAVEPEPEVSKKTRQARHRTIYQNGHKVFMWVARLHHHFARQYLKGTGGFYVPSSGDNDSTMTWARAREELDDK